MDTPDGKRFSKPPEGVAGPRPRGALARLGGWIWSALAFVVSRVWMGLAATARWLWAMLVYLLTALWRVLVIILSAIGKFSITTWRLASALDSALWRAIKLLARRFWSASLHGAKLLGQVMRSLVMWLPTRTGRAYSAASGVFMVICILWIVDLVREGPIVADRAGGGLRAPIDEEDPILARIGGRYVHLSEIEAAARASGQLADEAVLTPAYAYQRGLVENYVEQRLLASAALDEGLHREPPVLRRVNAARDRILAAALIQERIDEQVTPEKVRRFYESQRAVGEVGTEVRARHILVATEAEAGEIVALLKGGADFSQLAREKSKDRATAPLGGEIGWFSRPMMAKEISDAAFSTPVGEIAPPFKTGYGWHVLEVRGRRRINARPFSELKDDIEEFLRLQTIADTLEVLEDENQVVYYRPAPPDAPSAAPVLMPVREEAGAADTSG